MHHDVVQIDVLLLEDGLRVFEKQPLGVVVDTGDRTERIGACEFEAANFETARVGRAQAVPVAEETIGRPPRP